MMNQKALVVVSFGTTYPDALCAIEHVEERLRREFPGHDFYRAFTSGIVIRKLQRVRGVSVDTPEQLLEKLVQRGYTELLCQPTHVLNGLEYDKMCAQLAAFAGRFSSIRLGRPLLSAQEDYEICCHTVMESFPTLGEDEALVLMGHGTDHFANASYSQLENTFRALGYERVYVGTVEGFPDLDYVMQRLEKRRIRRVLLAPFLIVAGDHAKNDLAGDGEDSWKSILERAGYSTRVELRGLGSLDGIAERFAEHLHCAEPFVG